MTDATACSFPGCSQPPAGGDLLFCAEHRELLLDDPGEFRRRWGALEPRPEPVRPFLPRHMGGTAADPGKLE
jgi:hypothetical protein